MVAAGCAGLASLRWYTQDVDGSQRYMPTLSYSSLTLCIDLVMSVLILD